MAQYPKSTALKLLQGNRGKRPINKSEPKPPRGIPAMPLWLEAFPVAVREWERESKILDKMGVITVADEGILATRAYLAHLIQTLAWELKREGTTIDTKRGGPKQNMKMGQMQSALGEYRRVGYMLGLDPSGRTRLHGGGEGAEDDPFEAFRKR